MLVFGLAGNVFFVWELLRPLLKGATLYVVPDAVIYDSAILPQYVGHHLVSVTSEVFYQIKENEICRMLFTPSLLEAMLDSPGVADMTGLKLVVGRQGFYYFHNLVFVFRFFVVRWRLRSCVRKYANISPRREFTTCR